MNYLNFIDDETLVRATSQIIGRTQTNKKTDIGRNQLDPFGALFECAISQMDYEAWIKKEAGRQVQKSLQNAIGDFHQTLIGGLPGCQDVGKGKGLDTLNITNAAQSDNGNQYRLIVTNSLYVCSTIISEVAILTVNVTTVITNRRITYRVKKN